MLKSKHQKEFFSRLSVGAWNIIIGHFRAFQRE